MSKRPNYLGEYLRARREQVTPEQAGLVDLGGRRVPGLRREEVAMLAGISAEYYLRLERGRDRNPSAQVIQSIARVLRLNDDHLDHLMTLVAAKTPSARGAVCVETVPAPTKTLVTTLPHPAFVEGRYFDILFANSAARKLSPRITPGGNQLLDVFLKPSERSLYVDHDGILECYVSSLRQSVGQDTDDPRFIELVGKLSVASQRFRQLWSRHDVSTQRGAPVLFDHPLVGKLLLHRERLEISGSGGLTLVMYHAEPNSLNFEKLKKLSCS